MNNTIPIKIAKKTATQNRPDPDSKKEIIEKFPVVVETNIEKKSKEEKSKEENPNEEKIDINYVKQLKNEINVLQNQVTALYQTQLLLIEATKKTDVKCLGNLSFPTYSIPEITGRAMYQLYKSLKRDFAQYEEQIDQSRIAMRQKLETQKQNLEAKKKND